MIEAKTGKTPEIGFREQVFRKLITAVLGHTVLRSEATDGNHSLDKAEELLGRGSGLIVIINHFSLKDPPQAIDEIFRHTVMGKKKIVVPIAVHMDNPLLHWLGKINGVTFKPVVTKKTTEKEKYKDRELNDGMLEYLSKSIGILKEGGIVILAPQGTRMPNLGQPDNPTVGAFMAAAKRKNLDNYVFLFIGMGIKGIDDYSKKNIKGLNPLKKYTIKVGACLTSEEILTRAENKFKAVDGIIFEELGRVVPPNYR